MLINHFGFHYKNWRSEFPQPLHKGICSTNSHIAACINLIEVAAYIRQDELIAAIVNVASMTGTEVIGDIVFSHVGRIYGPIRSL